MTVVNPPTPDNNSWKKWKKWADDEGQEMWNLHGTNGTKPTIKPKYKERKLELFAAFGNRCAYCESLATLAQSGDVEHYRPKLGVDGLDRKPVMVQWRNKSVPHRGYFWLTYEWENLLPCCGKCNRPETDPVSGMVTGKHNVFPVAAGSAHAIDPAGVASELPLLLNPRVDDPASHLELEVETGILKWKSIRGEVTIAVLGLNRADLVAERKRTYYDFLRALIDRALATLQGTTGPGIKQAQQLYEDYQANLLPYMMVCRKAEEEVRNRLGMASGQLKPVVSTS